MKKTLLTLFIVLPLFSLHAEENTASDTLFAPDRLIQVEVTMAPEDWQALRISHRVAGENFSQIVENPYEYYPVDIVIDGHEIKSVGSRQFTPQQPGPDHCEWRGSGCLHPRRVGSQTFHQAPL